MPAQIPVVNAALSRPLHPPQYILGIAPTSTSGHLILRHPSPDLSIADGQSLQVIDSLRDGHRENVTGVCSDQGSVWSSAKDSSIIRWDERSRTPGTTIRGELKTSTTRGCSLTDAAANIRKPLPVTALAVSERDYLVIGGTELVSAEAHILFW